MKKHVAHIKLLSIAAISIITFMPSAFAASSKTCSLSVELQNQEARMQYASRLATAISSQPTSVEAMYQNTQQASLSSSSSDNGFTLFSFGNPDPVTASSSPISGIDQFSAECLSCHDGVSAMLVQPNIKEFPSNFKTYNGRSAKDHSIGMRYDMYVGTGNYKTVVDGTSTMLFVDGKVGCLSCHDPLNPEKKHLVKSDVGSALCMTCHIR